MMKADEPRSWRLSWIIQGKPSVDARVLLKQKQRVRCRERHTTMEAETRGNKRCYTAGFENGRVGHELGNAGDL